MNERKNCGCCCNSRVLSELSVIRSMLSQVVRGNRLLDGTPPTVRPIYTESTKSEWELLDSHEVAMRKALPGIPIMTEEQLQIKNGFRRPQLQEDIENDVQS